MSAYDLQKHVSSSFHTIPFLVRNMSIRSAAVLSKVKEILDRWQGMCRRRPAEQASLHYFVKIVLINGRYTLK
jgi:hypothetical protein